MTAQALQKRKRDFAVIVRDGADRLLYLDICRGADGDVYVNFPRDHVPRWKPHSSYHASGQHHQRSFDHKSLVYKRQKPDANFRGTQNVVTTDLPRDKPRAINVPYDQTAFEAVCEIPINELSAEKCRTFVSVDLVEPNAEPSMLPTAKVIRRHIFKDALPWITVTVFDSGPCYSEPE